MSPRSWSRVSTKRPAARRRRSSARSRVVDLEQLFRRTQDVCAYACAELTSPAARDVLLMMGSDDGIVVWVNGEKVHAINVSRPCTVDQDRARARLTAGKNRILVKILQNAGQWAFCLRIADPDGRPIDLAE